MYVKKLNTGSDNLKRLTTDVSEKKWKTIFRNDDGRRPSNDDVTGPKNIINQYQHFGESLRPLKCCKGLYEWPSKNRRRDGIMGGGFPIGEGKVWRILYSVVRRTTRIRIFDSRLNDFYTRDPDARTTGSAVAAAAFARLPPPPATTVHNP